MRSPALAIFACAGLSGCTPAGPATVFEMTKVPVVTMDNPWLAVFKTAHGIDYDPNSRLDRSKMAVLKGETLKTTAPPDRQAILQMGRKLIGTMEATGRNDGPIIEAIQKSAGISKGDPYCAAFNYWCYKEAGHAAMVPRSGWSPDWVAKPTWKQGAGKTPQAADAFGIYFASKGRVAHTGLIEAWHGPSTVTLEANTNPSAAAGSAADRNGDGIWRKRRLISQIHAVRDWAEE